MKVRANGYYVFDPAPIDRFDRKAPWRGVVEPGAPVQVRNVHGYPPCNTMGHAYIFSSAGHFAGLVSTGSLSPVSRSNKVRVLDIAS